MESNWIENKAYYGLPVYKDDKRKNWKFLCGFPESFGDKWKKISYQLVPPILTLVPIEILHITKPIQEDESWLVWWINAFWDAEALKETDVSGQKGNMEAASLLAYGDWLIVDFHREH